MSSTLVETTASSAQVSITNGDPLDPPARDIAAARAFCRRLIGYAPESAESVELALIAVLRAAARLAPLVLHGDGDLVGIALALHRRLKGTGEPFVVCEPRRKDTSATSRMPANESTAVGAFAAARAGTVCARGFDTNGAYELLCLMADANYQAQLVFCTSQGKRRDSVAISTAQIKHDYYQPLHVAPLAQRSHELPRIVDEYVADARRDLGAPAAPLKDHLLTWILGHAAKTLPEIEKATTRLVALESSPSISAAARRIAIAPSVLTKWLIRYKPPTLLMPVRPSARTQPSPSALATEDSDAAGRSLRDR